MYVYTYMHTHAHTNVHACLYYSELIKAHCVVGGPNLNFINVYIKDITYHGSIVIMVQ